MTRRYEAKTLDAIYDRDSGAVFEDLEFHRCRFEGSAIGLTRDPKRRTTLRRIAVSRCEVRGCSIGPAIIEDSLVDGLKTGGLFQVWGAVYKHVTIRGKIGEIMLSADVAGGTVTREQQRAFDADMREYYRTVDWALDIREAEFEEADLRGVPGRLVWRDPETQVLVTRERVARGEWRQLDLADTHWDVSLQFFLESGAESKVLVAPKRARDFKPLLQGLQALRAAGVTEPD